MMKKKNYITPDICNFVCEVEEMIAASMFTTSGADEQRIIISEGETDVFTSRRNNGIWED